MRLFTVSQKDDGSELVQQESVEGSGITDQTISALPAGATFARVFSRSLFPYTLEANAVLNPEQFGQGKYYSKNFTFNIDAQAYKSIDARRAMGQNMFTNWMVKSDQSQLYGDKGKIDWSAQMQEGEGMIYLTQNFLGDQIGNEKFHIPSLQDFLLELYHKVPAFGVGENAKYKCVHLNIETIAGPGLLPGQSGGQALPGYSGTGYFGNWEVTKNQQVVMEATNETITLETLAGRGEGAWVQEMYVRRSNRMALIQEVLKFKGSTDLQVSAGMAPIVTFPFSQYEGGSGAFWNGFCNVTNIGGDAQGNITLLVPSLGNRTFKLDGDHYSHSHFCVIYWYQGRPFYNNGSDESEIFDQKKAGTQTYQYLWSKIKIEHVNAHEKAIIQQNQGTMKKRTGAVRPFWRQIEPFYEFYRGVPFQELLGIIRYNDPSKTEPPRVWQPPWDMYTRYCWIRFFGGDEPGWGFYMFPADFQDAVVDPNLITDSNGKKYYNHPLHPITALFQARNDMQPFESMFVGTTLVQDPEVQENQAGDWVARTGSQASNNYGGVEGTPYPVYSLRYKEVPGGWLVMIIGGAKLGFTSERTDLVRVPGGLLNGNQFRVKLRGPAAQCYVALVQNSDSNQTYDATPVAQPSWEKAGYAGRINQ